MGNDEAIASSNPDNTQVERLDESLVRGESIGDAKWFCNTRQIKQQHTGRDDEIYRRRRSFSF
jgi:hypothetical protein